jgi:hypothetical protein
MIEISKYRGGTCDVCKGKTAEYSIRGGPDEWTTASRPCQPCMLALVRDNEIIRSVLILQGGAS